MGLSKTLMTACKYGDLQYIPYTHNYLIHTSHILPCPPPFPLTLLPSLHHPFPFFSLSTIWPPNCVTPLFFFSSFSLSFDMFLSSLILKDKLSLQFLPPDNWTKVQLTQHTVPWTDKELVSRKTNRKHNFCFTYFKKTVSIAVIIGIILPLLQGHHKGGSIWVHYTTVDIWVMHRVLPWSAGVGAALSLGLLQGSK